MHAEKENYREPFAGSTRVDIFAPLIVGKNGSVAQLDRASHYGCEGLGFESLQGHRIARLLIAVGLFVSSA